MASMTALQSDRHEQNQRAHQMTMSEKEQRSLEDLILQWIRYTEDTQYLRRKHEALLDKIGGGDTDANHQGDAQPGVAGQQADTDDFEWEPRSDCS
jgi:hypothetical protein